MRELFWSAAGDESLSSKCSIALGILEFFNDAVSFNLNDEFGKDFDIKNFKDDVPRYDQNSDKQY